MVGRYSDTGLNTSVWDGPAPAPDGFEWILLRPNEATDDYRADREEFAQRVEALAALKQRPKVLVFAKNMHLIRVAARFGDGWCTSAEYSEHVLRKQLAALREACRDAGRDQATIVRAILGAAPSDLAFDLVIEPPA